MSFKLIKDWFFTGLRRGRNRHGQLVVSSEGEAMIVVRFAPKKVEVFFTDLEPPIDPCHPHPHDSLDFQLEWLGNHRWGVKIKWSVFGVRHVKYQISGVA